VRGGQIPCSRCACKQLTVGAGAEKILPAPCDSPQFQSKKADRNGHDTRLDCGAEKNSLVFSAHKLPLRQREPGLHNTIIKLQFVIISQNANSRTYLSENKDLPRAD